MRMQDKVAVVTGGGSGYGTGIVRKFSDEGAQVVVADIRPEAAQEVASAVGGMAVAVDVGQGASVAEMTAAVLARFGRIDVLVNNAGVTHPPGPLEEVDEEAFDRVFRINAKSVYLTARHVVPAMKAAGRGVILNIGSGAGVSPRPNLAWYNSSKGWMNIATKSMALELAPHGIRVNIINPVSGDTPMLAQFMGGDTPDLRAKFMSSIPLGRFSTPEDVAHAAVYLCSDESSLVTGSALMVDGGRTI
ncbi:MAG: glucose 1-dehydrogenase [Pseudorhodobacter sp.]